jgi:cation:H+ antiporter
VAVSLVVFGLGAVASLTTSWALASRLERIGELLGLTEGLLGLVAALAADTPEITSALTALSHHQHAVGAGVVLGSNVFNLAALLGLSAVMAGRTRLHRRVILLDGAVGLWTAGACLCTVSGVLPPAAGLLLALTVLVPYVVALAGRALRLGRLVPGRWSRWLRTAVAEEELDLLQAVRPRRGTRRDAIEAAVLLVVVVVASVAMERSASSLGRRWAVPDIVLGGIVLAGVTSIPNAAAGIYLGARGRSAALLSTALNSNTINVVVGLLIPATVTGVAGASSGLLVAAWYAALTGLVLGMAWSGRGLVRSQGLLIIGGYVAFVATLVSTNWR